MKKRSIDGCGGGGVRGELFEGMVFLQEDDRGGREVVYMERPIVPNLRPSLADVLLCTFESRY